MTYPHHAIFGSDISWDGTQVTFNIFNEGKAIRCAITRSALAAVCERSLIHTPDVLRSFALQRNRIEALAWAKFRMRPTGIHGRVIVRFSDIDGSPIGGASMTACPHAGLLQAA